MNTPPGADAVEAWVALGANLGDRAATLASAVTALSTLPGTQVTARSRWYQNPAVGGPPQPDFLNGVVRLQTTLMALPLLDALLQIEAQHGRRRGGVERNAPRTLDLDLLWHGQGALEHPQLTLPHPRLTQRDFVLQPLLEIDPALALPGIGPLQACLDALAARPLSVFLLPDPCTGVHDA